MMKATTSKKRTAKGEEKKSVARSGVKKTSSAKSAKRPRTLLVLRMLILGLFITRDLLVKLGK
ncbi:hypothetical protein Bho114_012530 [Bartonella sp. 114]|nr:hypothetical protein Bho114_012530 [Bartonella sp. 114]